MMSKAQAEDPKKTAMSKSGVSAQLDKAHNASNLYLDGMPYHLENVLERMAADVGNIGYSFIDLGKCALAIKAVHGHGEFQKIIRSKFEEPDIMSLRTIYRSMQVASFWLDREGNKKLSFFTELPRMKQLMLSAAADSDIDPEEGTIFGYTPAELKAKKLTELKDELADKTKKLDEKNEQLRKGREQLADAKTELDRIRRQEKILGLADEEIRKKLTLDSDRVYGIMANVASQIEGGRFSELQKRMIKDFFGKCMEHAEELGKEAYIKLQ